MNVQNRRPSRRNGQAVVRTVWVGNRHRRWAGLFAFTSQPARGDRASRDRLGFGTLVSRSTAGPATDGNGRLLGMLMLAGSGRRERESAKGDRKFSRVSTNWSCQEQNCRETGLLFLGSFVYTDSTAA